MLRHRNPFFSRSRPHHMLIEDRGDLLGNTGLICPPSAIYMQQSSTLATLQEQEALQEEPRWAAHNCLEGWYVLVGCGLLVSITQSIIYSIHHLDLQFTLPERTIGPSEPSRLMIIFEAFLTSITSNHHRSLAFIRSYGFAERIM